MTEQKIFSDDEADAIFSAGLALARNNQEREAIEVWLPLARAGDLSAIENIIYASSIMGNFDYALPWLARFSNSEFESIEKIATKLGLPVNNLYWFIAENQNTSLEVLTKLSNHANRNIRWAVATNQSTPTSLVIEIAKFAHTVTFSDLGEFECVSCGEAIENMNDGVWREDSDGLCAHCFRALSVDDIQCYFCNNRVVNTNLPLKVAEYFEKKCNSGQITVTQYKFIMDGFNTDGGQLIGKEVFCHECNDDEEDGQ